MADLSPTTDLAARFEAKREECEVVVKKWIGHNEVVEAAWRNRASAFAEARDMARADAAGGAGEGSSGACLTAPDHSASPSPSVSALTGECSSRDAVDFEDLDRLFALMPEGPWHALRTGDGHEIRQTDTDPTNKHHWPFRLCQSIAGQRAACDDAVFAFISGVLNAWPSISAANSDDAFIDRMLAMPEDELRKRFLIDGKCPEQAADIAKQSFRIAELKVALMQISSQYVENRGDMMDAEALQAIEQIATRALAREDGVSGAKTDDNARLVEYLQGRLEYYINEAQRLALLVRKLGGNPEPAAPPPPARQRSSSPLSQGETVGELDRSAIADRLQRAFPDLSRLDAECAAEAAFPECLATARDGGTGADWISVEDRLPGEQGQDSEEVIVFLSGHCGLTDMECRKGAGWGHRFGFFDAERQCFRVHGRPDSSVTHWMPKPAAPALATLGATDQAGEVRDV